MIDSLLTVLPSARDRFESLKAELQLPHRYAVLTLHRPSNVDDETLDTLIECLEEIGREVRIIFPLHPRTAGRLADSDLLLDGGVLVVDPLGYRDFVSLLARAAIVFTDSGGIQEETSVLGVPCITLRNSTERPITCELGTNQLTGPDPESIKAATRRALDRDWKPAVIPFWDGNAAQRIVDVLVQ